MMPEDNLSVKGKNNFTTAQWASLFGLLLLFLILRWNSFTGPFERDEGEYAYSAWLMRGGIMPYEQSFLQKPPMIIYTYILGQLVSENSELPPRLFAALSVVLTTILVGFIVSRDYGKWTGIFAMWIMTPMLTLHMLSPFAANTEVFMILPLFCVLALYNWKREKANSFHWFAAGVCAALAFLYKPIVLFVLLFIFFVWLFDIWKVYKKFNYIIARLVFSGMGAFLTTVLVVSPFLLYDSGNRMYECVVKYNIFYSSYISIGIGPFIYFLKIFWNNWWILFLLPLWLIIKPPKRWWFYTGLFIIAMLTVYSTSLGHYYIMVVPFWAILTSISIEPLFMSLSRFLTKWAALKKLSVIAVVIFLLILPNAGGILKSPEDVTTMVYGEHNPFLESPVVADRVAEITDATDKVFIAGSEPQVLFYAKRKSPSRFIIMYPLTFNTPLALRYQEETIQALKDDPPDVIVLVKSVTSWLFQKGSSRAIMDYINTLINGRYKLDGGVRAGSKQWDKTVNETERRKYSMLVYKVIK